MGRSANLYSSSSNCGLRLHAIFEVGTLLTVANLSLLDGIFHGALILVAWAELSAYLLVFVTMFPIEIVSSGLLANC